MILWSTLINCPRLSRGERLTTTKPCSPAASYMYMLVMTSQAVGSEATGINLRSEEDPGGQSADLYKVIGSQLCACSRGSACGGR